jgi:hypothetical protein
MPSAESKPPKYVTIRAKIIGPSIPAIEVIIRWIDNPVTRSLLLSDFIEIISEAGVMSLREMVSYTPIKAQNGHDVTRKRINAVGTDDARPIRYSRFKFRLRSVNHPDGSASSMFTALLMLLISPISTVVAPKRLIKTDQ